jgi:hypothetical protein
LFIAQAMGPHQPGRKSASLLLANFNARTSAAEKSVEGSRWIQDESEVLWVVPCCLLLSALHPSVRNDIELAVFLMFHTRIERAFSASPPVKD